MNARPLALLFCGVFAACAPPEQGPRPREPAPSEAVEHRVGVFEAEDETELFQQAWIPKGGEASAAVVLVHGLKDHSGRYDAFARRLVERGYAVWAFDLRGHGRSGGRRVWVDSFDAYLSDLGRFMGRVRRQNPGRPIFLFGHSMGGAVVTLYTVEEQPELAGLILSGPALRLDLFPITVAFSRFLGGVFPSLPALRLPNEDFSSDPDVVEAMGEDPLVYQPAGPAGTAAELLAAIARIWEGADRVTAPLLLLHGTEDLLTDPQGSRELYERARSADKTLEIYEGFRHDLLHEPRGDEVEADIVRWLETRS